MALLGPTIGSAASAARPGHESAHAAVACSGYGHPVLAYPFLYAISTFRCRTGAPKATVTSVLEGFKDGRWTTIESASRTVQARPGKSYTVRTKRLHCTSTPRHMNVRSEFKLVAPPLVLRTPPSGRLSTYCI